MLLRRFELGNRQSAIRPTHMHEHRVHVHNEVTCFVPIQRQSTLVDAHTYMTHLSDCHTLHSTSAAYKLLRHQDFLGLGCFN